MFHDDLVLMNDNVKMGCFTILKISRKRNYDVGEILRRIMNYELRIMNFELRL